MSKRRMKYNPAFLSEDELVESFVVRRTDLELIVEVLRENLTQSNQQILVIGPRGIGKTMLVLRVAAEVRRTEELRDRWYPLVFAEESYPVTTPGEFWLEALFHLHQQTRDDRWKRTHDELLKEHDDDRLRARALARLMDFADAQGKRILLIVENFNMLLGDQMSSDDAWTLRHTLLHEPRVMLLASATDRFEEIENADKAMFDLFKVHRLRPLDEAECRRVWTSITGHEPRDNRIRPIQILTGGNPRLLTIISTFGARLSFKELIDDLMQLVDEHTEYFKSHLDKLAPIERKAYLALAELWDPVTAREVGRAARLDVSKTSSLLNRLAGRGAVAVILEGPRKKCYQVAERMYNIYYLMRRRGAPSWRVRTVVKFIVGMYGPERATRLMTEEAERVYREAIEEAPQSAWAWARLGDLLHERLGRYVEAEMMYRKAIELEPDCSSAWKGLGLLLLEKLERPTEALELARKYVEDTELVEKAMEYAIYLFVGLAAAGYANEALEILRDSPSAGILEPLVVGLRLFVGEDVRVAAEILEVGRDVVKRIEERQAERGGEEEIRASNK